MKEILSLPQTSGARNYFISNTTNATVEKSFAIQKSDKSELKLPLEVFIKKHWVELQGLQREFWDGIMKGTNDKLEGTVGKNETKGLKRSFSGVNLIEDDATQKVKVPEECWKSAPMKKKPSTGTYLQPPKSKLSITAYP